MRYSDYGFRLAVDGETAAAGERRTDDWQEERPVGGTTR